MKKATKEKNTLSKNKKSGIFDYEKEIDEKPKIKPKKTKKIDNNSQNEYMFLKNENQTQVNKKAIKKIQKKKKAQANNKKNIIREEKRKERKINQKKLRNNINKPKKKINTKMKVIIILVVTILMLILLMLSPVFYIKEVQVENNQKVPKQEILSLLHINETTNIFKERNSEIKEKLKENPYIDTQNTKIERMLPSILKINIKERTADYMLEFGGGFLYIDQNGKILENSSQKLEGKIIIQGYHTPQENLKTGNTLNEQDVKSLSRIMNIEKLAQKNNLADKITSINISNEEDYVIYMESEKKKVHIGDDTGLGTKMLYIKAILEKEKDNEGEIFVNMNLNKENAYFKQNV